MPPRGGARPASLRTRPGHQAGENPLDEGSCRVLVRLITCAGERGNGIASVAGPRSVVRMAFSSLPHDISRLLGSNTDSFLCGRHRISVRMMSKGIRVAIAVEHGERRGACAAAGAAHAQTTLSMIVGPDREALAFNPAFAAQLRPHRQAVRVRSRTAARAARHARC